MRGKRVLGENSRRPRLSKNTKTFSDGKVKGRPENIVLIELDDDDVVIIDDAPKSMDNNFGISEAPRDRENTNVESVINIDDEDSDDDGIGVGGGIGVVVDDPELASDANSSQSRFPRFRTMESSVDRDTENSEFGPETSTAFRFSKCKRPNFTKSPTKNRFGLDPAHDDVSTGSDSSDCEIGSDSEGWKTAALRRKRPQDQTSACESNNGEKRSPRPGSGKADRMEKNQSEFAASDSGYVNASYRTSPVSLNMDDDQKSEERAESVLEKEFSWRNEDFQPRGGAGADEGVSDGISGNKDEEPCPHESFTFLEECDRCRSLSCRCIPIWSWEKASVSGSLFRSFEQEVGDKEANPPKTPSMEKNNLDSRQAFVRNSNLFHGTRVNVDQRRDDNFGGGSEDIFSRHADSEGTSLRNSTQDRNVECAQEDHVTRPVETCIITDRQKLKDTDEFRRAEEEEWAARQRELQIQAEESQKLRRRKKAETLRLNNIERRQKERVEEVRENEKKNAEDINLKEQFRGEIRKEINKLEITCIDMPSLLRGLGIPVNGGFKPMSKDVNAAYKRALLKFHPDRASRMDIRQQVESEEKFKLISRMKEKFLTSCC